MHSLKSLCQDTGPNIDLAQASEKKTNRKKNRGQCLWWADIGNTRRAGRACKDKVCVALVGRCGTYVWCVTGTPPSPWTGSGLEGYISRAQVLHGRGLLPARALMVSINTGKGEGGEPPWRTCLIVMENLSKYQPRFGQRF